MVLYQHATQRKFQRLKQISICAKNTPNLIKKCFKTHKAVQKRLAKCGIRGGFQGLYNTFNSAMQIRQLALIPKEDVTRNPTHWYQWPKNRTSARDRQKH